ncbi:hypothetical protein WN55_01111 [Dufourea novaeangliae]|uniref:Uncharacterized protein n=1 Tax=Dufourea novaeangliae TaxID=178035 RepID=A0A154PFN9_DUFNO|nr:hypothetical protein WN55_01111 [Dufourea novaeangliae]
MGLETHHHKSVSVTTRPTSVNVNIIARGAVSCGGRVLEPALFATFVGRG